MAISEILSGESVDGLDSSQFVQPQGSVSSGACEVSLSVLPQDYVFLFSFVCKKPILIAFFFKLLSIVFCSNASDALDKLRFLSVTEPALLGDAGNLEIRIKPDPDNGTITIRSVSYIFCIISYYYGNNFSVWYPPSCRDTGIGMTKEELIDCLGTIAQSGTSRFLKALKVVIPRCIITHVTWVDFYHLESSIIIIFSRTYCWDTSCRKTRMLEVTIA